MSTRKLKFEVVEGETDHISYSGERVRRKTVLIRVGNWSFSRKAFLLGAALVACQIWDGALTYLGLRLLGVGMEGNAFLRELMHAYGQAPVLFVAKMSAIVLVVWLTFHAHSRKWIRPIIFCLILTYLVLAVAPWAYIISQQHATTSAPINDSKL